MPLAIASKLYPGLHHAVIVPMKPIFLFAFVYAVVVAILATDVLHYSYLLLAIHDAEDAVLHFESAHLREGVFRAEFHRLTQEIAPRSELISLADHVNRQPDRKCISGIEISIFPFLQLGHLEELYTKITTASVSSVFIKKTIPVSSNSKQGYRIKVGGNMGNLLERMATGNSNFFLLSSDLQGRQELGLPDTSTKAWKERFSQASLFLLHRLSLQLVRSIPQTPSPPPLAPYDSIPNLANYHKGQNALDFRRLLYTIHSAILLSTRPTDELGLQSNYSVFFPECRVRRVFLPQYLAHFIESPFSMHVNKGLIGLMVRKPQQSILNALPKPPQSLQIPLNAILLETPDSLDHSSPQYMFEGLDELHFVYIQFDGKTQPVQDLQKHRQLLENLNGMLADDRKPLS